MQSAFGVEHGEISKALPAITPKRKARRERNRAVATQRLVRRQKINRAAGAVISAPGKAARAKISVADVGSGAGKGVARVGMLVAKKPALTGTALLAGGAYGGYKMSQPKKKTVHQ